MFDSEKINTAADTFPEYFTLRHDYGRRYRISRGASFCLNDGSIQLVIQAEGDDGKWRDYTRDTPAVIRSVMRRLP